MEIQNKEVDVKVIQVMACVVLLFIFSVLDVAHADYQTRWYDIVHDNVDDEAAGIDCDLNGNCYVTGTFLSGAYEAAIIKYGPDGTWLFADTLSHTSTFYGGDIACDNNGNLFFVGHAYMGGNYDFIIYKFDSSGIIIWGDTVDNGDNDQSEAVAVDESGNITSAEAVVDIDDGDGRGA